MTKDDEDVVLAVVGAKRAPIVIKLNEFNGKRTIDFRRYFFTANSQEPLPTQKGVSLDVDSYQVVKNALSENDSRIAEWLHPSTDLSGLGAQHSARAKLQTQVRPHKTERAPSKTTAFFQVYCNGGVDKLTLNSSHPFIEALERGIAQIQNGNRAALIKELMDDLLLAYHRSKLLFDGCNEMAPEDIFETLELNWGAILKVYAERLLEHE